MSDSEACRLGKVAELSPADAVRVVIIEAVHTVVRNPRIG